MALRAARVALLVFTAAAACAPPIQNGGVEVRAGAAERLGVVCRFRHGSSEGQSVCAAPEERAPPARVRRLAGPGDALNGPFAAGRPGDYRIENDQIVVVIDQLGPGAGFAESGGNLIDAADVNAQTDELGQLFTYFGTFPRQALYLAMSSGVDPSGTAFVEARGHELYEEKLLVTTRYSLAPGQRALQIETTLENRGDAKVEGLDLGDAVQWGGAEKLAPGKEPGFARGDYVGPWIGGAGPGAAYALVGAGELTAKNGTGWSNVSFVRGVAIAPGQKVSYARALAVAPRGDALGAATEAFFLQGGSPGGLEIALEDSHGGPLAPPPGARIVLRPPAGAPPSAPLWIRLDRDGGGSPDKLGGDPAAEAPPGRYTLGLSGAGRHELAGVEVTLEPGQLTKARLKVSDAGALKIALVERKGGATAPSPGKLQLLDAASGARVGLPVLVGADGHAELPAAPGSYRILASRGPEFSLGEASATVTDGQQVALELAVERVVDTRGFLACDLHQHSALSADCGVSGRARVISNAAEGVECAVASEHNVVGDLGPVVEELGLGALFRSIGGDELTSDASRDPFGHVNVFPLARDPQAPRGGALPVRDRTARQLFDALLASPGDRVLQVNHPRSGRTGYFDQGHFDPAVGVGSGAGYDPRFDALEVWNGRNIQARAKVLADLWALLRTSHPVTPTASTDTHGIVGQEAGYPRTWIRVPNDDPAALDPAALVEGLKRRRDVVLSNGPFVTLHFEGGEQGDRVKLGPRGGDLTVHVERAPWVDATRVVLWVGGVAQAPIPLHSKPGPSGALVDDVSAHIVRAGRAGGIAIKEDTWVVATVEGERPLEPVLSGDPAEILPFAMTSPLWIDADGDGQALGR